MRKLNSEYLRDLPKFMQLVSDQLLIKLRSHGPHVTELNSLFGEENVRDSMGFRKKSF